MQLANSAKQWCFILFTVIAPYVLHGFSKIASELGTVTDTRIVKLSAQSLRMAAKLFKSSALATAKSSYPRRFFAMKFGNPT